MPEEPKITGINKETGRTILECGRLSFAVDTSKATITPAPSTAKEKGQEFANAKELVKKTLGEDVKLERAKYKETYTGPIYKVDTQLGYAIQKVSNDKTIFHYLKNLKGRNNDKGQDNEELIKEGQDVTIKMNEREEPSVSLTDTQNKERERFRTQEMSIGSRSL